MKTRSTSPERSFGRFVVLIAFAILSFGSISAIAQTPPSLNVARHGHTATVLADGRILVFGGDAAGATEATAEIVDIAAGTSTPVALSGIAARTGHTATRLADGRVLIAGGSESGVPVSATLFIDADGNASPGPNMSAARSGHTAVYFSESNNVLFIGGDSTGSAEVLDVAKGTSQLAPSNMSAPRSGHSSVVMNDGRVLIVGGNGLNTAEIFNGSTFVATGNAMTLARAGALLRTLPDGKVQIIGGNNDGSMEVYDPEIDTIGAYAHVIPSTDICLSLKDGVKASQTRAALFGANIFGAPFDRTGAATVELGSQALIIGGTNGLNAITPIASSTATVTTDKLDYAPGETATITGTGFGPNEAVRIVIHEDPKPSTDHIERKLDTTTDANGNFTVSYQVELHDLNLKFILNAKGATSGTNAQTTFTDGNVSSATISIRDSNCSTVTNSFNLNANVCGAVSVNITGGGTTDYRIQWYSVAQSAVATSTPVYDDSFSVPANPSPSTITKLANASGTWTVVVCKTNNAGPCSFGNQVETASFTVVGKSNQTITFNALGAKTYGDADFAITASASSNLPVSFAASGNCSITGSLVHVTGAGSCTVTASQAGNDSYNAADNVSQTFSIAKANANVVATPYDVIYDGQPHTATATVTGVNGETGATVGTVDLTATTHTDADTYNDTWTFTGTANYNNIAATPITNKISPATQAITVTAAAPTTATYGSTFNVTATGGNSGNAVAITASGVCTGGGNGTATITMTSGTGTCTIKYNQAGNNNYSAASEVTSSTAAEKAVSTTTVSCDPGPFTYTGSAITPCTVSVIGAGGLNLTPNPVYTNNTNAGIATASYTYAESDNHLGSNDTKNFTIDPAAANCASISGAEFQYDANPHVGLGSCKDLSGNDLAGLAWGAGQTNVPGGPVTWSFTSSNPNYADNSGGSVTVTITKATATISVAGYTVQYDGQPHGLSGTATGVGGANLTSFLTFGSPVTDVPGGQVTWNFDAGANYNTASGTATVTITQASSTTVVTCPEEVAYNSQPQTPCEVSVTGINLNLTPEATYTNNENVGTATASYNFAGDLNHTGSSDSETFQITTVSLTITGAVAQNKTYDGNNTATVDYGLATLTGRINGDEVLIDVSGAEYSATFDNENVGNDKPVTVAGLKLSGADANNYTVSQPTGLKANITKQQLTLVGAVAEDRPYNGTDVAIVDFTASELESPVSGDDIDFDASGYSATFANKNVGNGIAVTVSAVVLTGADAGNYDLVQPTGLKANITPAVLTAVLIGNPTKIYDGNTDATLNSGNYQISGLAPNEGFNVTKVAGSYNDPNVLLANVVTVALTAEDFEPANDETLPSNYSFPTSASGPSHITKAASNTTVTFEAGPYTYRGTAFTATGNVTGAGNLSQPVTPVNYTGDCLNVTSPNGCTASAEYTGDDNHFGSQGNASITVTPATPTVSVSFTSSPIPYDGVGHPATVTVTGVSGALAIPANGTVDITYTKDSAPFVGVPTNAGGYTASASFTSTNANYSNAASTVQATLTIEKVNAVVVVNPYDVTYDALPHTASVTSITGVNGETGAAVGTVDVSNTTHTDAGTYENDTWSFTGTANYNDQLNVAITNKIGKASSTVTVDCSVGAPFTYTGSPITPCTAQATGVGMSPVDVTSSIVYANITNAGPATAQASWDGDNNHTGNTGNGGFTIDKAASTTAVSCPPSIVFNGTELEPCSATVAGAGGLSSQLPVSYTNNVGPGTATASASYAGGPNHNGSSDSKSFLITNIAPSAVTLSSATIDENGTATITGSFTDPDAGQSHKLMINWGDGSGLVPLTTLSPGVFGFSASKQFLDDNPTATPSDSLAVSVIVTDGATSASGSSTVTVNNVAPVVTAVNGPAIPQALGSPVLITANYTDVGTLDTHKCDFNWDDSTTTSNVVANAGSCSSTKTFTAPGVYSVIVTVKDDDSGTHSRQMEQMFVVVFDPNGGFVTGGGWIMSPVGACQLTEACATQTGKANFGFVSKYKKGSNVPEGQTEFQFHAGSLNFNSTSYMEGSLVISSFKAQYRGTGTVNGVPGYDFVLTAYDGNISGSGGVDKFRMKITKNGATIYDNRDGVTEDIDNAEPIAISGGSIVIHTPPAKGGK